MKDIEHARMMLDLAMGDFKALGGMADPAVFDDGVFGFHAQQAVEKSIKAWLAILGAQYPKTHDVRLLLNLLHGQGVDASPFLDLVEYNIYAVQFRYESCQSGDEPIDREEAIGAVSNLINRVKKLLDQK